MFILFFIIGSLARVRLIRPRLDSFRFSLRFLRGVCFLSRASAMPGKPGNMGLRRMVMVRRAVMVFFMFWFPLLGFWLCYIYIYLWVFWFVYVGYVFWL